ncbi:hypothetical protein IGI04_020071 [Brassica rapa subsp. trilocularis]|uniref:F-box domain-containing protein n=1 Tax=Brassica rapa subsp. trilocularis TaxID=1813537 RepID=A0ABQ7MHQ5_BRACM|nr:hypothetical protein IGI04_020071 [Brassica rapa subsp. trilocularis]
MTVMSYLPGDLLEEILCRVPAVSLKRLRSSCKRWNRLFNDKQFSTKHLDKAAKQSLVFKVTQYSRACLMSVNLHGTPSVEFKGELSLLGSHLNANQVKISSLSLSDTRIVLWNPFTGKTRWIQPRSTKHSYALGSYKEPRCGTSSYKILSYRTYNDHEFEIYEINSNTWRILDFTSDFELLYIGTSVSFKGKTYWFASDREDEQLGMFLVSFDYTTERFGRLSLPCKYPVGFFHDVALSVVGEEKLSVLLQPRNTRGKEIWVTNKIDGTKEVSWRKFLTVNYPERDYWITFTCFWVDEEKKVALCCEKCMFDRNTKIKDLVYIAGEDNEVKLIDFGAVTFGSCWPVLDYFPSLAYIQPGGGLKKRKRKRTMNTYALGSYKEPRCGTSSYKILSYRAYTYEHEFEIYDINSNTWRILDATSDFKLLFIGTSVFFKGKTYWFASDREDGQLGMFLRDLDACKCPSDFIQDAALSVVGEEKLSIDGCKEVSWRKFLTVDPPPQSDIWFNLTRFWWTRRRKLPYLMRNVCLNAKIWYTLLGRIMKSNELILEQLHAVGQFLIIFQV